MLMQAWIFDLIFSEIIELETWSELYHILFVGIWSLGHYSSYLRLGIK